MCGLQVCSLRLSHTVAQGHFAWLRRRRFSFAQTRCRHEKQGWWRKHIGYRASYNITLYNTLLLRVLDELSVNGAKKHEEIWSLHWFVSTEKGKALLLALSSSAWCAVCLPINTDKRFNMILTLAVTIILQTWERDGSWLYCIDFLREEEHPYSWRYRYAVKWSIPTRRKPIPRATASVYITIEVSKFKPKVW